MANVKTISAFKHLNKFESSLFIFLLICIFIPLLYINPIDDHHMTIAKNDMIHDIVNCGVSNDAIQLPLCPIFGPNLVSNMRFESHVNTSFLNSISRIYSINIGGYHRPNHCLSRQNVAIIIPYRNRWDHLQLFLQYMHPFLSGQSIEYTIFVIEQNDNLPFNRGKLFNIGFVESLKLNDFCCMIFHDIDILPQNQLQLYMCSQSPRHMCWSLDKFRYVLIYPNLVGGGIAVMKSQFELLNGFSNEFFGWGGEDDDFSNRIKDKHLNIIRWDSSVARCVSIKHKKEVPNSGRIELLNKGNERFDSDGINSLKYKVITVTRESLYTKISVEL